MNFLKKIFGAGDDKQDGTGNSPSEFSEGDVFYTGSDDRFHIYKLLKHERDFDAYHVLSFQPVERLPNVGELEELEIFIHHTPIDKNGFVNPRLLTKKTVTAADLSGYHEYLRQTRDGEDIIRIAGEYYDDGNRLSDEKKFEAAIGEYSKAIDLIPAFYEAIDNRAFAKMDLARWAEAVEDFESSLAVYPESADAVFSIGECYLKMRDYAEAKAQFERALKIDPHHRHSRDFLDKMIEAEKSINS